MTSYKKLYNELKREYDALKGNSIDLRKPDLTMQFKEDKWDWEIQEDRLAVSKKGAKA